MSKIRVLVVEDSLVFRELLVRNLNQESDIEVIAIASDPYEARDKIIEFAPDVMTLDIELPHMDGIEFVRKLIPQYPMPVVMISSLSDRVFDALRAGAVDFVAKPMVTNRVMLEEFIKKELPNKIRIASKANITRARNVKQQAMDDGVECDVKNKIIAIGASTGGTEATARVLQQLGDDLPGIVIVQHMPAGFTKMYANRLDNQCKMNVKEAKTGDIVAPGTALVAPGGDMHMEIVKVNDNYQVIMKRGPKVNGHCPSVDVMFESVAKVAGKRAMGIILTGMGGDGAKGLLSMRRNGARTIGQDESTCVVYGMPKVAYDIGAVEYQDKLDNIPGKIYQILRKM